MEIYVKQNSESSNCEGCDGRVSKSELSIVCFWQTWKFSVEIFSEEVKPVITEKTVFESREKSKTLAFSEFLDWQDFNSWKKTTIF